MPQLDIDMLLTFDRISFSRALGASSFVDAVATLCARHRRGNVSGRVGSDPHYRSARDIGISANWRDVAAVDARS